MTEGNDNKPAGEGAPPEQPSEAPPPSDNMKKAKGAESGVALGGMALALSSATSFMSQAGKEWFNSLVNQPTDPPFNFDSKFEDQFDRIIRLVVAVILLTGIVVGSVGLIADKSAALQAVKWTMWILIIAFLSAIVYGFFSFLCGVRVHAGQERRKLTVAQILHSILYILVPWIPIFAFLRTAAQPGRPRLGLILILLFYVSVGYMILNFTRAIRRLTRCSWYFVWLSVLLPISLVVFYALFGPPAAAPHTEGTDAPAINQPTVSP